MKRIPSLHGVRGRQRWDDKRRRGRVKAPGSHCWPEEEHLNDLKVISVWPLGSVQISQFVSVITVISPESAEKDEAFGSRRPRPHRSHPPVPLHTVYPLQQFFQSFFLQKETWLYVKLLSYGLLWAAASFVVPHRDLISPLFVSNITLLSQTCCKWLKKRGILVPKCRQRQLCLYLLLFLPFIWLKNDMVSRLLVEEILNLFLIITCIYSIGPSFEPCVVPLIASMHLLIYITSAVFTYCLSRMFDIF